MRKSIFLLLVLFTFISCNLFSQYTLAQYQSKPTGDMPMGVIFGLGMSGQLLKSDNDSLYTYHNGLSASIGGFTNIDVAPSMTARVEFSLNRYASSKDVTYYLNNTYKTKSSALYLSVPASIIYTPDLPDLQLGMNIKPYGGFGLNVNVLLAQWYDVGDYYHREYFITDGNASMNYGYQIMAGANMDKFFGEIRYERQLDMLINNCPRYGSLKLVGGFLF